MIQPSKRNIAGILLVLAAITIMLFLFLPTRPGQEQNAKKIGIVQYLNILDPTVEGLKEEMRGRGYEETEDIVYFYKSAEGRDEDIDKIAREFIAQDVDLIYAVTSVAARGALDATIAMERTDIPIVFAHGDNPLEAGVVQDLKSSGNNATGVAVDLSELFAKKLEILREIEPSIERIAVFHSTRPHVAEQLALAELQLRAPTEHTVVQTYPISQQEGSSATAQLEDALAEIKLDKIDAIVAIPSSITSNELHANMVADFGKEQRIPTVALTAPQVKVGFLFAYAHDLKEVGRQAAVMVDKIFQGTAPADIPIEFPQKNSLIVNLQTAREAEIPIPDSIQIRIDITIDE